MAKPQLEDGFTEIANEILEALYRINLSSYESRVLWFIIRKTYGWHKKNDKIPLSQIAEGTRILKPHISRTLKSLISRQIVTRTGKNQLGVQKDYEQWQIQKLPKQVMNEKLPVQVMKVTCLGNEKLPIQVIKVTSLGTSKEKKDIKETIQKKIALSAFEDYLKELRVEFSDLDVNEEWKKCQLWWEGKSLKRPKLALRNWLNKARLGKQKEVSSGTDKRHPKEYTAPDSLQIPVVLSTDPETLRLHGILSREKTPLPEG